MARLLWAIGISMLLLMLTACATPHVVTYGAPLTKHEAIKRGIAPPEFGCRPSVTDPSGLPMGGCI